MVLHIGVFKWGFLKLIITPTVTQRITMWGNTEKSNVSSVYFDMLARLCNVYLVFNTFSQKLLHYLRLGPFEIEQKRTKGSTPPLSLSLSTKHVFVCTCMHACMHAYTIYNLHQIQKKQTKPQLNLLTNCHIIFVGAFVRAFVRACVRGQTQ